MVTLARMFRLLRLARILRVLRLFRFLRELVLICRGIVGAMRAMCWAILMIFIVIFMCSLSLAKLVGHQCCDPDADPFTNEQRHVYFRTIPQPLFTLFVVMTLENGPAAA